jgi:predicted HAD superfamily phosphohydrolase YqeG
MKNTRQNLTHDVEILEKDVLHLENAIIEFSQKYQNDKVKNSIRELRSDLKHLAILTNGEEMDTYEYRKIMNFLRVHYKILQEKLAYSNTLT